MDGRFLPIARLCVTALLAATAWSCGTPEIRSDQPRGGTTFDSPDLPIVHAQIVAREALGLRADEAYVQSLNGDDAAVLRGALFGLPLSDEELIRLRDRRVDIDDAVRAANLYGAGHALEWGGLVVEPRAGVLLSAHFTGNVAEHRQALNRLLYPAKIEVRLVMRSLVELQNGSDAIARDPTPFEDAGATVLGVGVDVRTNKILVDLAGGDPDRVAGAVAHFGGRNLITVRAAQAPPWEGPVGHLIVMARHEDGTPVEDLTCRLLPDERGAWGEDTRKTGDLGRCVFQNVGAVGVTVQVGQYTDGAWTTAGEARTNVVGNDTVTVLVAVDS